MTKLSNFFRFWKVKENRTFGLLMIVLAALPVSLVALQTQQVFRNQAAAPKSPKTAVVVPLNPLPEVFSYHAVITDGSGNFFEQVPKSTSQSLKIDGPMTIEAWINFSPNPATTNLYGAKRLVSYKYEPVSSKDLAIDYSYTLDVTKYFQGSPGRGTTQIQWNKEDLVTNFDYKFDIYKNDVPDFEPNRWYHIASTFDGNKIIVYLNGEDTKLTEYPKYKIKRLNEILEPGSESKPLSIGMNERTSGFDLKIDEVRISKGVRNVAENFKAGIYNSPFRADSETVGLWHFDQNPQDSSSNRNNLLARGNVKYESSNSNEVAVTLNPWKVEYYNNSSFRKESNGKPFKTENLLFSGTSGNQIEGIMARFGTNAPISGMQKDNFSIRYTKNIKFQPGTYKFTAVADDTAKINIKSSLLKFGLLSTAKSWTNASGGNSFEYTFTKEGLYPIIIEFKENTGNASLDFSWKKIKTPLNSQM